MASYSKTERLAAKILESTPWLRDFVRWTYKRVIYLKHKKGDFKFSLEAEYQIKTPYELIGENQPKNEVLFFGYYDKSPWNKSMTKIVLHSLDSDEKIKIKVFDLIERKSSVVAASSTWNYQQGAMVQWLDNDRIVFNEQLESGVLGCKVLDLRTKAFTEHSMPVQCVTSNGKHAVSLNYSRLMWLRPDYGYHQTFTNFERDMNLDNDGLWIINLETGNVNLEITIAQLLEINPTDEMSTSNHKVNHVMYSPDNQNFVFMHRWIGPKGKWSRLYNYNLNMKKLTILLDEKMVSHYSWINKEEVITWARHNNSDGYFSINVITKNIKHIQDGRYDSFGDGHPTVNQNDQNQIITDTYPDKGRIRHLLQCQLNGKTTQIPIGQFFSSWKYEEEKRCDLHPRWSPDGRLLSIDSAHNGERNSYVIMKK